MISSFLTLFFSYALFNVIEAITFKKNMRIRNINVSIPTFSGIFKFGSRENLFSPSEEVLELVWMDVCMDK